MGTLVGLLECTDPELARRVDEHVWIGRGFALVDTGGFEAAERDWMERAHGPAPGGRCTLPLRRPEPVELPGMRVSAPALAALCLGSITSDKMLYRQGRDTVHLLAADPLRPGSEQVLVITADGVEYARRAVRLGAAGMGLTVDCY